MTRLTPLRRANTARSAWPAPGVSVRVRRPSWSARGAAILAVVCSLVVTTAVPASAGVKDMRWFDCNGRNIQSYFPNLTSSYELNGFDGEVVYALPTLYRHDWTHGWYAYGGYDGGSHPWYWAVANSHQTFLHDLSGNPLGWSAWLVNGGKFTRANFYNIQHPGHYAVHYRFYWKDTQTTGAGWQQWGGSAGSYYCYLN